MSKQTVNIFAIKQMSKQTVNIFVIKSAKKLSHLFLHCLPTVLAY